MKILFLSHKFYPNIGGIETISEILATRFAEAGHEVHLLTWSSDQTLKRFPFRITRVPNIPQLLRAHMWAEIVFENNPCIRLSWPSLLTGKPRVTGLQTWFTRNNEAGGWHEKLKLRWLAHAKSIIACSEAIQKKIWPNSIIIGNPFKEDVFKVEPMIVKKKDFVFVGRIVSDKGLSIAIKAFNYLISNTFLTDSTLTIIGDGEEKTRLEEMANCLGLTESISFLGPLQGKELVNCLNEHRFLLVPSVWEEPFGIVVLEGLACGCLPIVSDKGGLPTTVGDAGLTFKSGSVEDLVACILTLMNNPELEKQLRAIAEIHLEKYQSKIITEKYLKVLWDAL